MKFSFSVITEETFRSNKCDASLFNYLAHVALPKPPGTRGGSLWDQDHLDVEHRCFPSGASTPAIGKHGAAAPLCPSGSDGDTSWRVRTGPPPRPRCRKLQQELCHIEVRAVALHVSSVSKMLLLISVSFTCFCLKAVLGTLCDSACVGWAVLCALGLLQSKISCWLFQHQTLTVVISRRSPWNTAVVVVVSSPCAHGVIADAKTYLSSYYCYWALISSRNMNSGRMPQTFIN